MNKIYKLLTITMLVLGSYAFANATTYYSQPGAIGTLANWWTTAGGTGTHPSNFTTSGDIFINQTGCTCTGAINMGAGTTLEIDGTWNTASGTVGYIIITATGILNNTANLSVKNDWTNGGTYSASSTYISVSFNGTTDQTLTAGGIGTGKIFQTLTVNKSFGSVILNDSLDVNYSLNIVAGTLKAAGYNIYINTNYSNSGTFLHGNNTMYFIGSTGAYISTNGMGSGKCFYNVVVKKSGNSICFTGTSEIANNLTIPSGYFQIGTNNFLYVGGNFNNNGLFLTSVNTGTLIFNGTSDQYITMGGTSTYKRFWNVTINKTSGTAYLIGDMYVLNDFTIASGSFDVSAYNMTVRGSWSNNGTFVPHSQTVTFISINNTTTINGGGNGAGRAFYNITFNHSNYRKNLSGDMRVDGALLESNGTLYGGTGNYNIYISGNFTINDSFQPGNSTVNMVGSATQIITAYRGASGTNVRKFYNLTINKSGGSANLANNTEALHDVTLAAGTFDVTASNYSMYVDGSWINNGGTFNAHTGIVFFTNNSAANISGSAASSFYRITVANTAPLIVSSNTTITNQLSVTTGSYMEVAPNATLEVQGTLYNGNTPANDNHFIIRSTTAGSGSLINNTTGQRATVECFVSGGAIGSIPAKKHFISTAITGLQGAILNDPTTGNYNVYTFMNNAYVRIFGITALVNGEGYLVNYNSDRTIPFAGVVNTGTISKTIDPTNANFTMVGNPYPAAISCSLFTTWATNDANIYGGLYFWSQTAANNTGDYAYWTSTGSSGGNNAGKVPNGFIASGQGFMVAGYGAGSTIEFTNSMKVTGSNNQFFIVPPTPVSRFYLNVVNPFGIDNEILIGFTNMATRGFDKNYDAWKLKGCPDLSLYTMMYGDQRDYAIQALPPVTDRDIIPVGLDAGIAGNYTFNLGKLEDFDPDVDIYLKDLKEQKTIDLRQTPSYSFTTEAGNFRDRFIIVFKNRNAVVDQPALNNEDVYIYSSSKTIYLTKTDISYLKGDLLVTDLMGRKVYSGKISGLQSYELKLDQPAGCYVVSLNDGGKVWVKKVWVE